MSSRSVVLGVGVSRNWIWLYETGSFNVAVVVCVWLKTFCIIMLSPLCIQESLLNFCKSRFKKLFWWISLYKCHLISIQIANRFKLKSQQDLCDANRQQVQESFPLVGFLFLNFSSYVYMLFIYFWFQCVYISHSDFV